MIHSDLIQITEYELMAKLPDPFKFTDGSRVKTREDWSKRKEELFRYVEMVYGRIPPKPDVFHVETLGEGSRTSCYRITSGPYDHPVSFSMTIHYPTVKKDIYPVVIDGDMCWDYVYNTDFLDAFRRSGIAVVLFNRLELAADLRESGHRSPLYRAYPDLDFGALLAWAWGYSRCVDAVFELGIANPECIAFTGHSRGGKAAFLAGVLDERATIVNPNESGAGGCGSFKIRMKGVDEEGNSRHNESLEDLLDQFDYWFSPELKKYYGHAEDLPFDMHEVKALIAPRILLEGNAASDLWANPVGSVQTAVAAAEVFKFLGAENNLLWYFRRGVHWHKSEDAARLARIMNCSLDGTTPEDEYHVPPFRLPRKAYDWSAPEAVSYQ